MPSSETIVLSREHRDRSEIVSGHVEVLGDGRLRLSREQRDRSEIVRASPLPPPSDPRSLVKRTARSIGDREGMPATLYSKPTRQRDRSEIVSGGKTPAISSSRSRENSAIDRRS
jgi:hypothetical protein